MDTNHGFEVCLEAAALTLSVYWWRSPGPGGWHDLPETPAVTGRSGAKMQTPAVSSQGSLWWQAGIYLKICFETLQNWKCLKVHAELAPSWQEGSTAEIIFWGYELGCDKTLMNSLCSPMWQASHRSVTPDLWALVHLSHSQNSSDHFPSASWSTRRHG